ncbi:MAG: S8 family serine peptidase [Bacteroidetes bacterium]|nr:S8 family serine peptidase [Bacteroidota bacterium]
MKNLIRTFTSIAIIIAFSFNAKSQNIKIDTSELSYAKELNSDQIRAIEEQQQLEKTYQVVRGERPPINIEEVKEEAFEKGRIAIKIQPYLAEKLAEKFIYPDKTGFVKTGVKNLDYLNEVLNVKAYNPLFINIYNTTEKTILNREKHKAWGFHLWFEIELDEKTDIKQVVKLFSELPEIAIAEPFYKKELLGISERDNNEITRDKWTPNDPQLGNQWHYNNTGQQGGTAGCDISLFSAWNIEKGHTSVIVSIQDGGIQIDHVDLAANMWSGIGYNFVNNSPTITVHNHGVHVAGTVAAVNNNNIGVAGVAGGSGSGDGIRLMSSQVFTTTGSGGFHLAPIHAADNGAAISQNSWGYTSANVFEQNVLDAIDYFNANGGGLVLNGGITIFAAGNSNATGNWYPGCYSGTFAIAATNNQDVKSWYSNYGAWIDISAPGGETNTVTQRGVLSSISTNSYAYYQGTSMACPHASGVAALIVSYAHRNGIMLDNIDIADILRNSTDNHYGVNAGFVGNLGTGRLNAFKALQETQSYISGVLNPKNITAVANSTSEINISWTKNDNANDVMLVWSADGTFGTPNEGSSYSIGNTIPGGGIVLYRGAATTFNHVGLAAATKYYYRVFSYNASNEYSSGRGTSTATWCDILTSLPVLENFNTSSTLPICWEIIDNQGNGQVWQIGTHTSGLSGTGGNYAFLNSDGYGSGSSQNSDLVTPIMDLSAYTNVRLEFKHYFREYTGSSGKLFYSINGGASWVQIQQWSVTTANPVSFSQVISAVEGQAAVRFKWNYTGSWGYYWDIDDIAITGDVSTGVANPNSFTATPANSTQINLAWNKNTDNNNVMIAVNTSNTFGTPSGNYSAGQPISGGGTVIYNSSGTSFNHSGLNPSTTYYYKAWSYNSETIYSGGVTAQANTLCGTISTLPFTEGFEAAGIPSCWTQEYVSTHNLNWSFGAGNGGSNPSTAFQGSRNAYIKINGTPRGQSTKLITPPLNLSSYTDVQLTFYYFNQFWSPDQDVLRVYYKNSASGSWVLLNTYNANVNSWTSVTINIPNGVLSNDFYIAFEGEANWGYGVCIDAVTINGVSSLVIAGDVNGDGFVNVGDIVWMVSHLNGSTPAGFIMANADVNLNGSVNIADLSALINLILNVIK